MKIKVTYSQVKKALKAGFVSPLNTAKKLVKKAKKAKKPKFFDRVASSAMIKDIEIVRVVKRGTKRIFFRVERNGQTICSTMFAYKSDAVALAKHIISNEAK